jgi:hypothetical protein
MISKEYLSIYVVYLQPTDFPHNIIVRAQHVRPDGSVEISNECDVYELNELRYVRRDLRKKGLICIGRQPGDASSIVESWI